MAKTEARGKGARARWWRRPEPWLAAALALATVLAYGPALGAGYVWDDDQYVTDNALLREADGLLRLWVPGNTPQYYPAVFAGFWLQAQAHGLEPFGFHLVNVLLHAANALLVWKLGRALRIPGAGFVAALFALHPVHVESVAWVSERKNVQSACFYLLAFLAYLRFDEERERAAGGAGWSRPTRRLYAAALGLFLFALLSKTVTCSLPAAVVLALAWKGARPTPRRLAPLAPFFALGLALAWVTVHVEHTQVGARGADFELSLAERTLVASRALLFYARTLLVPWPLVFVHPRWTLEPERVLAWWPLALLVALGLLLAREWRRGRRGPTLAALYFAGTLVPALGFIAVYPMRYSFVADHFQYLASLGFLALAVGGVLRLQPAPRALRIGSALVLALLGWMSARQATHYADAETLWRHTLRHNPGAWMAHSNLAKLLTERGAHEEALAHLEQALAAEPSERARDQIRLNLALTLGKLGRHERALDELEALHAKLGGLELRLALTLERLERDEEAEARFRQALAGELADEARAPFALHLLRRGKPEEAVELLERALVERPDDADLWMFHSDACAAAGRLAPAMASAERALAAARARGDERTATLIEARIAELGGGRPGARWAR